LSYLLDAVPSESWQQNFSAELTQRLADVWESGPANLLDILGYLRAEEAYKYGRRVMRLAQEYNPQLEYLTFDLAVQHQPVEASTPAFHFAEFVKNRHVYLDLLANLSEMDAFRNGTLPEEEGGGEVTLVQVLEQAHQRDLTVLELLTEARSELGIARNPVSS
jgi:hypothetical protein